MGDLSDLFEWTRTFAFLSSAWRAEQKGLREAARQPGMIVYNDASEREWRVFDADGTVRRLEIDLEIFEIPYSWSPYELDQKLEEHRNSFYEDQCQISQSLGLEPSFLGYFEEEGFPEEESALDLAVWCFQPGFVSLQFSGAERFRRFSKERLRERIRHSLVAACEPRSALHRRLSLDRMIP